MAKATKKKAPQKPSKLNSKSKELIDTSTPGAETKNIPAKKQRTYTSQRVKS